jgi:hypothetical protein
MEKESDNIFGNEPYTVGPSPEQPSCEGIAN